MLAESWVSFEFILVVSQKPDDYPKTDTNELQVKRYTSILCFPSSCCRCAFSCSWGSMCVYKLGDGLNRVVAFINNRSSFVLPPKEQDGREAVRDESSMVIELNRQVVGAHIVHSKENFWRI